MTRPKNSTISRISQDILDRFSQSFLLYESALGADDRSVSYFPGTLPWQPNDVRRNEKVLKAD